MGEIQSYQDLAVWRQGRVLAKLVYTVTAKFPKEELYGITSQIRRCAVSIVSNIAEGYGRGTYKAGVNFFFIARGSLYEMETQLLIACDLGYVHDTQAKELLAEITRCKQLINGLIRYFESKSAGQPKSTPNRSRE
jgi:four helix bundle protein